MLLADYKVHSIPISSVILEVVSLLNNCLSDKYQMVSYFYVYVYVKGVIYR